MVVLCCDVFENDSDEGLFHMIYGLGHAPPQQVGYVRYNFVQQKARKVPLAFWITIAAVSGSIYTVWSIFIGLMSNTWPN